MSMPDPEQVEKMRQAIMRYRELLDLLHEELDRADRNYDAVFSNRSPEEKASLPIKELQRKAAYDVLDNPKPLSDAALHMRFVARNLEKDFEQLYDNIVTE